MKTLKQEYKIKAPVSKVWNCLTDPREINNWNGGPAKMKAEKGFKFSLWGGDIHGTNSKIVNQKEIRQNWMSGKWDEFSKVIIKLSFVNGITTIALTQSGIPNEEYNDIADGWNRYYFGEIKKLLEAKK